MSEVFGKNKLSALLMASLITANFVCASDAYKNNVVDVRVNGESGNAVKVTIYTDRPYTDPVVVNKKANNKYIILLPETNSSLKGAPTVTNASGTVSNVSVNTQNVTGGKGYTKIIITSEKTINVVPRTQQLTSKTAQKPTNTTTVLKTEAPVNTKTLASNSSTQKKTTQKPAQTVKKQQTQPKPTPTVKPKQQVQKTVQAPPKPVEKEPIKVLEQEVKSGQYANTLKDKNDEVLNNAIAENMADKQPEKNVIVEEDTSKKTIAENIKDVLKDYQRISLWKLLLLAGAVTFPIIVIMIILTLDKKINKKIDKTFKKEDETNSDYLQEEENVSENIEQPPVYESFDNVMSTADSEAYTESSDVSEDISADEETEFKNDFEDTDFEHDFSETENIEQTETEGGDISNIEGNVSDKKELEPYNPDGYLADFSEINDKDFIDELTIQTMASNNADGLPDESPADKVFNFMQEEESDFTGDNTAEEEVMTAVSSDDDELKMQPEVKINDKTGLYLVNYENFSSLVGHIGDEYFVLKKFDNVVSGKVILKQAEKLDNVARYLVRVGKNKMVIEVSDSSMTKLLDL